jgi:HD-GYP domain-containing protein (c-di-GMP phosphodiesterase class II)
MKTIRLDLRQLIVALSDALDLISANRGHGKRVAYFATELGKTIGLDPASLLTVHQAALLHDFGVSSTRAHLQLMVEFDPTDTEAHTVRGAELLRSFSPLERLAEPVLLHHVKWPALQSGCADGDIALIANCIHLADRLDALTGIEGLRQLPVGQEKPWAAMPVHQ